jgi:hypothetical protein
MFLRREPNRQIGRQTGSNCASDSDAEQLQAQVDQLHAQLEQARFNLAQAQKETAIALQGLAQARYELALRNAADALAEAPSPSGARH